MALDTVNRAKGPRRRSGRPPQADGVAKAHAGPARGCPGPRHLQGAQVAANRGTDGSSHSPQHLGVARDRTLTAATGTESPRLCHFSAQFERRQAFYHSGD